MMKTADLWVATIRPAVFRETAREAGMSQAML